MLEKEVVRLQKLLGITDQWNPEEQQQKYAQEVGASSSGENTASSNPTSKASSTAAKSSTSPSDAITFPFINDTFHYYDNYCTKRSNSKNFSGHCTWNILTGTLPRNASPESATANKRAGNSSISHILASPMSHTQWLREFHTNALINNLQLTPQFAFLPQFLLVKYQYDIPHLKGLIHTAISQFFKTQNSLIPILHPVKRWQDRLLHLTMMSCPNHTESYIEDPVIFLVYLYMIQLNWSCLDDYKLYQLTKSICETSPVNIDTLQCLLLASYYFMGDGNSTPLIQLRYLGDRDSSPLLSRKHSLATWATKLLHLAYGSAMDMGLYMNPKKMVPLNSDIPIDIETQEAEITMVTFWSFQILESWWSLIQGLPKCNFLMDEFHPRRLDTVDASKLKPLQILCGLVVDCLDGCNLLQTLTLGGRSNLIYTLETFRKELVHWQLYHRITDHEEFGYLVGPESLTDVELKEQMLKVTCVLTEPDMVEIQLTLFYLILTLFADTNAVQNQDGGRSAAPSSDSTSFEILSLYLLVLTDKSFLEQPQQLNILHVLPCSNRDIIKLCLATLVHWSNTASRSAEPWRYTRYRRLVAQWCGLWYMDEQNDDLLASVRRAFALDMVISTGDANVHATLNLHKMRYLQEIVDFNAVGRSGLLGGGEVPIDEMEHDFDMFANGQMGDFAFQDDAGAPALGLLNETHGEDDGYAEDDDEPLHIVTRRARDSLRGTDSTNPQSADPSVLVAASTATSAAAVPRSAQDAKVLAKAFGSLTSTNPSVRAGVAVHR